MCEYSATLHLWSTGDSQIPMADWELLLTEVYGVAAPGNVPPLTTFCTCGKLIGIVPDNSVVVPLPNCNASIVTLCLFNLSTEPADSNCFLISFNKPTISSVD